MIKFFLFVLRVSEGRTPTPKINTSQGFELSPIYNSLLRSENKNTNSGNTSRNTGSQLLTTSTH